MASKKFEKGSPEWLMFQDFWKLCQQFWIPEDLDEYWEQLTKEADGFCEKYKSINEDFVTKITLGYIDGLESEWKEIKTQKNYEPKT